MISISAFIISLSGIVSLLYFRLWEMQRNERLFDAERKKLDEKMISFGAYIQNHIPTLDRKIAYNIYHAVVHYFALVVLNLLQVVEKWMVSLLEYVRGKREITHGVTQSEFLKRVGDHKQSLEKPELNKVE